LLRKAGNDYEYGFLDNVQVLLKRAAQKDPLSPNPLLASGNLYLQYLDYYGPRQKEILIFAEKVYINAAKRNPADFRPYEKLAMVYNLLAERTSGKTKECNLNKSLDSARRTVELYPGLARLRLDLAEAAERLGRYDLALEEYKKAVEIEDAYREQFKIMYPTHELFSRLGQEQYEYAQKRIAELRH
jgi:tetratricopeptide (TPR) repeat protein